MNINENNEKKNNQNSFWKDFVNQDMELDFSAINQYIQEAVENNLPIKKNSPSQPQNAEQKDRAMDYKVLEMIGCTVIQVNFRCKVDPGQVQVLLEINELIVVKEEEGKKLTIPLAFKALPQYARACCHGETLEIRIPHDFRKNHLRVPIVPL